VRSRNLRTLSRDLRRPHRRPAALEMRVAGVLDGRWGLGPSFCRIPGIRSVC